MSFKIAENQTYSEHTTPAPTQQASSANSSSRRVRASQAQRERASRGRQLATTIVARAEHLPADEAAILSAIYERGMKSAKLARVMGCTTATLRHRVKALVRRVVAPTFPYVVVHRDQWPERTRHLATELFLRGRPMRHVADESGARYHTVRRQRDAIASMAANWHAANTLPLRAPSPVFQRERAGVRE